jgi:hypothetical protein
MYAQMEQISGGPGHGTNGPDQADPSASAAGQAGLLGSITFRQLAGPAALCLTLWDTEASATGFSGSRAALAVPAGEIYQVIENEEGPAADQAPAVARLLYFDGPRAPEQVAAADFAGRQRIWPAIRDLAGLTGICVLRGHDLGYIVVTLATSVETLDAAQQAVMATTLLPGEDLALLPGPDRIEIHHVTSYQVPAASRAAGRNGH